MSQYPIISVPNVFLARVTHATLKTYYVQCVRRVNMSFIHSFILRVSQSVSDKCQNPTTAAAGVFAATHSIDDEELNKLVSAPAPLTAEGASRHKDTARIVSKSVFPKTEILEKHS